MAGEAPVLVPHRTPLALRAIGLLAVLGLALLFGEPADAEDNGSLGATVFVDPLAAELRIRPTSVQTGNETNARATVTNLGPAAIGQVTGTLLIDPQGVTIQGGATRTLPGLAGGASAELSWRLCGSRAGNYLAMARITSSDAAGHQFRTETLAVLLEVTQRRRGSSSC